MGIEHNQISYDEADRTQAEAEMYIDQLEEAGWVVEDDYPFPTADVGRSVIFHRKGNGFSFDPETTAERLGVPPESSDFSDDFDVRHHIRTGGTVVEYNGGDCDEYRVFLDDLIAHGWELRAIESMNAIRERYGSKRLQEILRDLVEGEQHSD